MVLQGDSFRFLVFIGPFDVFTCIVYNLPSIWACHFLLSVDLIPELKDKCIGYFMSGETWWDTEQGGGSENGAWSISAQAAGHKGELFSSFCGCLCFGFASSSLTVNLHAFCKFGISCINRLTCRNHFSIVCLMSLAICPSFHVFVPACLCRWHTCCLEHIVACK